MEAIINYLKQLDVKSIFFYTLGFLAIICPGVLLLYTYDTNFFIEIESIKLILLSASITVPFLIYNFVFVGCFVPKNYKTDDSKVLDDSKAFHFCFYNASFATIGSLYGSMFISIIIRNNFKIKNLILTAIAIDVVCLLFIFQRKYMKIKMLSMDNIINHVVSVGFSYKKSIYSYITDTLFYLGYS